MSPKVAVITATKNRKQHLLRCVESVAAQTYTDFEHIIVDDNSIDGTWGLLQQLCLRYKHLRIFQTPKPGRGGARGRNFGVQQTQAELIAYLDDDDGFYNDHLATLIKHFEQHEDCQFAYCAAHKSQDGQHITGTWNTNIWNEDIRAVNLFPLCAVMHTKKVWLAMGGMDESLGVYEDWDLWQRMVHRGYIPCFINYVTSIVDSSLESSIQHSESIEQKQQVGEIIKAKMSLRNTDYHAYLKERIDLGVSPVKIPKKRRAPTHKDVLKEVTKARIQDDNRAWFWRVIRGVI